MNAAIKKIALACAFLACVTFATADEHAHEHPTVKVTEQGTDFIAYGEKMPVEPQAIALSKALTGADLSKALKLSGRIGQVCQSAGCWMMLTDGDAAVRVKFGDHAFVIPTDTQGEAVVYGTLAKKELTLDESKHMAEDAGKDPATVTEPTVEYRMVATALRVTK